jgi:hypothetical protein
MKLCDNEFYFQREKQLNYRGVSEKAFQKRQLRRALPVGQDMLQRTLR